MAQQVRSLAALPEGLGSIPQHIHDGSQPSMTVPGNPTSFSGFHGHWVHRQTLTQSLKTLLISNLLIYSMSIVYAFSLYRQAFLESC